MTFQLITGTVKRKGVTFAWKDQFANYFNMSAHVL